MCVRHIQSREEIIVSVEEGEQLLRHGFELIEYCTESYIPTPVVRRVSELSESELKSEESDPDPNFYLLMCHPHLAHQLEILRSSGDKWMDLVN